MAFSFLTQKLAIDLGTANTIIIHNDKIVVDEPSIVAIDQNTGKPLAIGKTARLMQGKTHENIKTIRPLRDGVIADFNAAEQMVRGMIKMINPQNKFFMPSLRMVVCIPSGSTEVEIRAVRDSSEHAGGRDVYMIYEPMAAALGIGIDVTAPEGNMVVDVGGGTTEIAVIALEALSATRASAWRVTCSLRKSSNTCATSTTSRLGNVPPRISRYVSARPSRTWITHPNPCWCGVPT